MYCVKRNILQTTIAKCPINQFRTTSTLKCCEFTPKQIYKNEKYYVSLFVFPTCFLLIGVFLTSSFSAHLIAISTFIIFKCPLKNSQRTLFTLCKFIVEFIALIYSFPCKKPHNIPINYIFLLFLVERRPQLLQIRRGAQLINL